MTFFQQKLLSMRAAVPCVAITRMPEDPIIGMSKAVKTIETLCQMLLNLSDPDSAKKQTWLSTTRKISGGVFSGGMKGVGFGWQGLRGGLFTKSWQFGKDHPFTNLTHDLLDLSKLIVNQDKGEDPFKAETVNKMVEQFSSSSEGLLRDINDFSWEQMNLFICYSLSEKPGLKPSLKPEDFDKKRDAYRQGAKNLAVYCGEGEEKNKNIKALSELFIPLFETAYNKGGGRKRNARIMFAWNVFNALLCENEEEFQQLKNVALKKDGDKLPLFNLDDYWKAVVATHGQVVLDFRAN